MLKLKFPSPLWAPLALASVITAGNVVLPGFLPQAQNLAIAAPPSASQEQIELITVTKGKTGSGDQLRRFFYGDLEPLGVQPGGAGMVVNLYSKKNDVTFSYCATYDVVVAVKKGRVAMFPADEVK
ncbi:MULTISPECIES: hypothetical protein [unclassified Synechocystis]|uniref:hypothetical protein n=1 Tax=unclassified Synechocystis TaxID=2640012 RepID=UPI000426439B|nr:MULTISPECIES: hypothetical protein [unclassified Synechocystis]AIE74290.1 hypothetical protein D082_17620 [Synechocystis sp. PCC 6714]MCT0254921.1 hypothetical protein [Synechocystis sp. CS-94]